jgi:thioredoxin-like negative regulator of GroEL
MRYGVRAMPTLVFFLNGQPVERLVGAVTKKQLVSIIRNHVSGNPDDKDFFERFMGG